jgi:hypothetical protein
MPVHLATTDLGTTANKVVQLDGSAKLPAVDASQLTGAIAFALKAWVNFTATGIADNAFCTINASSGVTSVKRVNDAGEIYYEITLSTPMGDANYAALISGRGIANTTCFVGMEVHKGASALRTTTKLRIYCLSQSFGYISPEFCSVLFVGN